MSNFVLTLPIHTELWQQHILDKRLNIARQLYNDCLNEGLKRIKRMRSSQKYRHWIKQSKSKERTKTLQDLLKKYGVNEFSLINYIATPRKVFKNQKKLLLNGHISKEHIDSFTAQSTVKRVWKSLEGYLFEGKKVHFKRYGELDSVEGKTNDSGIRYKDGYVSWSGLKFKTIVKNRDYYAMEALQNQVKYVRLVRKEIKGKTKYYAQLTEDNLNGKSLDWYSKEYYTVSDKMDKKVVLQRVSTVEKIELGKEHFVEVWSSMQKGDEVVIFYHPQTNEMVKTLVIVP
jgi:hypothetical protein